MNGTLSDQLRRHEQKQARLDERRAELREHERKAQRRSIMSAGHIVEKSGLLELSAEQLLGALLSIQRSAGDQVTLAAWEAAGRERIAQDHAEAVKVREPFVITFAEPIGRPTWLALRHAGFRKSKVFGYWEGMATIEEAEAAASVHQGTVRRVNGSGANE